MKTTIYCIPGMGTDRRVFEELAARMPDINWRFWEFIEPTAPNEPMETYIARCIDTWEKPEEPPIVLGMSLGGILAVEWCKRQAYRQLFLVSTLYQSEESPTYFKWLRAVPMHRIVPAWLTRMSWGRWGKFFGITDAKGQEVLKAMIQDCSVGHLRWGRNTAVNWKNEEKLERVFRIHGTRDHVFPYKKLRHCDYTIKDGTHCAVMNNAEEIAGVLREKLF